MNPPSPIPFDDFGGSGPPMHFAHANGYPPGAYRPLLELLAGDFHVIAMHMRPLWPEAAPESLRSWEILSDDLSYFLDEQGLQGLIGVGHSMGATATLRLALRRPLLFRALVLIDPVFFPPWMIALWKLIHRLGMIYRFHPLVKSTHRRRSVFESQEAMFANYRSKSIFQGMDDRGLQAYVGALAHSRPDGSVELVYSSAWEAHIYLTSVHDGMPLWRDLVNLKPPLLVIRGGETNTFWESTAHRMRHSLPQMEICTIPGATHLVPLEEPEQIYKATMEFLEFDKIE